MRWKELFPKENIYYETENGILYCGEVLNILKRLPDENIDCVITSPPYWALRDYGVEGQIGLEPTFQEYLETLWRILDEVYRILKPTGTLWVNLGDTYGGSGAGTTKNANIEEYKKKAKESYILPNGKGVSAKLRGTKYQKCLLMIPERFAIGMIERGWILRNQIIWHKPNAMPQSVKDRFTVDFEKILFFVKQRKYYFEQQLETSVDPESHTGIRPQKTHKYESGKYSLSPHNFTKMAGKKYPKRNKRTVWSITTKPFKDAHFAVFPPEIPETCIKAGCPEGGIVMDIFMGSGTTAVVAERLGRKWIGIELNPDYCKIAKRRIEEVVRQPRLL